MSTGRRERLCAYTIGRALIEIDEAVRWALKAKERVNAGDMVAAEHIVSEIRRVYVPAIEALLNNVDTVCLGIDEEQLKSARSKFSEAKEYLSVEKIDDFATLLSTLKWDILRVLVER